MGLYGFRRSSCSSDEELELVRWGAVEVAMMKEHEGEEKSPLDFGNAKTRPRYEGESRPWSLTLVYDIQGRLNRASELVDLL